MHWSPDYLLRALNLVGWLLVYSAIFLYEDQEGKIQNRIVQWWVQVDDARIAAHSRVEVFVQVLPTHLTIDFVKGFLGRIV